MSRVRKVVSGLESVECKAWNVKRWSVECRVGIGKCKVWSLECKVGSAESVNCGMLSSVKRGVWGVECSGEWEVGSVKCRV